jgi:hypothetical protein
MHDGRQVASLNGKRHISRLNPPVVFPLSWLIIDCVAGIEPESNTLVEAVEVGTGEFGALVVVISDDEEMDEDCVVNVVFSRFPTEVVELPRTITTNRNH